MLQDAALVYAVMNSPLFVQYVGDRGIVDEAQARTYIADNILPLRERLGYSSFVILHTATQEAMGICGLYDRAGIDGIDLGYSLLPQYHGKGYAMEAAQRLVRAAFENFGLTRLSAITDPANLSSQRVLQKLGFEQVGTTTLPYDHKALLLFELMKPGLEG